MHKNDIDLKNDIARINRSKKSTILPKNKIKELTLITVSGLQSLFNKGEECSKDDEGIKLGRIEDFKIFNHKTDENKAIIDNEKIQKSVKKEEIRKLFKKISTYFIATIAAFNMAVCGKNVEQTINKPIEKPAATVVLEEEKDIKPEIKEEVPKIEEEKEAEEDETSKLTQIPYTNLDHDDLYVQDANDEFVKVDGNDLLLFQDESGLLYVKEDVNNPFTYPVYIKDTIANEDIYRQVYADEVRYKDITLDDGSKLSWTMYNSIYSKYDTKTANAFLNQFVENANKSIKDNNLKYAEIGPFDYLTTINTPDETDSIGISFIESSTDDSKKYILGADSFYINDNMLYVLDEETGMQPAVGLLSVEDIFNPKPEDTGTTILHADTLKRVKELVDFTNSIKERNTAPSDLSRVITKANGAKVLETENRTIIKYSGTLPKDEVESVTNDAGMIYIEWDFETDKPVGYDKVLPGYDTAVRFCYVKNDIELQQAIKEGKILTEGISVEQIKPDVEVSL